MQGKALIFLFCRSYHVTWNDAEEEPLLVLSLVGFSFIEINLICYRKSYLFYGLFHLKP